MDSAKPNNPPLPKPSSFFPTPSAAPHASKDTPPSSGRQSLESSITHNHATGLSTGSNHDYAPGMRDPINAWLSGEHPANTQQATLPPPSQPSSANPRMKGSVPNKTRSFSIPPPPNSALAGYPGLTASNIPHTLDIPLNPPDGPANMVNKLAPGFSHTPKTYSPNKQPPNQLTTSATSATNGRNLGQGYSSLPPLSMQRLPPSSFKHSEIPIYFFPGSGGFAPMSYPRNSSVDPMVRRYSVPNFSAPQQTMGMEIHLPPVAGMMNNSRPVRSHDQQATFVPTRQPAPSNSCPAFADTLVPDILGPSQRILSALPPTMGNRPQSFSQDSRRPSTLSLGRDVQTATPAPGNSNRASVPAQQNPNQSSPKPCKIVNPGPRKTLPNKKKTKSSSSTNGNEINAGLVESYQISNSAKAKPNGSSSKKYEKTDAAAVDSDQSSPPANERNNSTPLTSTHESSPAINKKGSTPPILIDESSPELSAAALSIHSWASGETEIVPDYDKVYPPQRPSWVSDSEGEPSNEIQKGIVSGLARMGETGNGRESVTENSGGSERGGGNGPNTPHEPGRVTNGPSEPAQQSISAGDALVPPGPPLGSFIQSTTKPRIFL